MRHPGLRRGDAWHRQEEPHPPYPRAGGGQGFGGKPLSAWLWTPACAGVRRMGASKACAKADLHSG